ncbi:hypothetical protein Anapl_02324 [Anas platyrhynchos]|uniref:Uncharacterized protein n=1 Tax=Anas platyrhynchos TaxID=8839 RepID=R0JVD5_ANAPL|nr:hypothetical protein Anapl_02324 [Anas platyrhynchos]
MLRVVTSPWCLLHPFGTRSRLVLLLATSPCSETALQEQAASCCSVCGDTVVFDMFFTILPVTTVEKNTAFLNHLDFPLQGGFSLQEEAAPRSRTGQCTLAEAALQCPSRASTFCRTPWNNSSVLLAAIMGGDALEAWLAAVGLEAEVGCRSLKRNNKKGELNQTEETTNLKLTEGVRFNIRLSIVFYFVLFSPRPWARKPYVPLMPGRGQDAVIAVLLRRVMLDCFSMQAPSSDFFLKRREEEQEQTPASLAACALGGNKHSFRTPDEGVTDDQKDKPCSVPPFVSCFFASGRFLVLETISEACYIPVSPPLQVVLCFIWLNKAAACVKSWLYGERGKTSRGSGQSKAVKSPSRTERLAAESPSPGQHRRVSEQRSPSAAHAAAQSSACAVTSENTVHANPLFPSTVSEVASISLVDVTFLWNSVRIPSAVAVVQLRITVKPRGYKITNCVSAGCKARRPRLWQVSRAHQRLARLLASLQECSLSEEPACLAAAVPPHRARASPGSRCSCIKAFLCWWRTLLFAISSYFPSEVVGHSFAAEALHNPDLVSVDGCFAGSLSTC